MKNNREKLIRDFFSSYRYSIKRRIRATYSFVYILICVMVLVLFAAAFGYSGCRQLSESTPAYSDSIFQQAKKTSIFSSSFSVYLNTLVGLDNIAEIYITDSTGRIIAGSTGAGNNKNIAPVRGENTNIFTDIFPKYARVGDGLYLDITPFGYTEGDQTLYLVIAYSLDSVFENLLFIGKILGATMAAGFLLFNIAGITRTDRMLRPIKDISEAAKKISAENMDVHIDEKAAKYELGELASTINDMVDRIRIAYDKQKRFVSDVSHELRTPIAVISGYAGMLKRWGKDDPKILDESIDAVIAESENMKELVERLLFLTRNDNDKIVYEMMPADIGELVVTTVKEENMVYTDFDFTCDIDEGIICSVDSARIKQTLRILLDNAVKYSGDSRTIQVYLRKNSDSFTITVADHGVGISETDLPYIFERFYRADTSRTKETGGYGLGLAIAKAIVTGHGGTLKVKSKLGEGSEFSFTIPITLGNN